MSEPNDKIAILRAEMNARLGAVEKCLERMTATMEQLTENRERLLILETRFQSEIEHIRDDMSALREEFGELKDVVRSVNKEVTVQSASIVRLNVMKAIAIAIASALLTAGVSALSRWFG